MPAMKPATLLLAAALLAATLSTAAARAGDLEAWIDTEERDGLLVAIPRVKAQSTHAIRYEMSARRSGPAGSSNTKQAGARTVKCCEPLDLAHVRLNAGPADTCALALVVYEKEEEVARVEKECKKP